MSDLNDMSNFRRYNVYWVFKALQGDIIKRYKSLKVVRRSKNSIGLIYLKYKSLLSRIPVIQTNTL